MTKFHWYKLKENNSCKFIYVHIPKTMFIDNCVFREFFNTLMFIQSKRVHVNN